MHSLIPGRLRRGNSSTPPRHSRLVARLGIIAVLLASPAIVAPRGVLAQHRAPAPFVDQGTFTLVADDLAADIDPASNESEFGDTVIRNIDEDLIRLAGSTLSSYEPDLATSWSSNADKSVWTFHLRHGVRFHTGRCCMTADDVRYSLGRSVAAQLAGSYMLGRFLTAKDPLSQIKVLDQYTVQFRLGRPQPMFLGGIAQDYNAMILDAQAARKHATKSDPWAHNWVTAHDIGTGPYMIQTWTHNQQVVLKRFPQYWDGWSGPHFGTIILNDVPDGTTRRELVERGQAQMTFDLTPQDYDALKSNRSLSVLAPYATEIIYVTMTEYGPLASPYARQALSYAFPYDALIQGVYRGYAKRSYGPIPSTVLGFDPHHFTYQTDLNKAKALFAKAGVKPGTTLTFTYEDPYGPMGQLLKANLEQIGINLTLTHLDSGAFETIFYSGKTSSLPNLMPYSWWPDYNDPFDMANTLVASSQQAPNGNNGGMYHNSKVDAILKDMEFADRERVVADAKVLQDLTSRQDPPAIWAAEPAQAMVLAKNIRGYVFNPVELRTYYFYTMYRV